MKPVSCPTCKGTRRTPDGRLCQNCSSGRRVRNPAMQNSQTRTPAQVGQALKTVLWVGMAAGVWALNHYFGGDTTEDSDGIEGPGSPPQAAANDFSPWEPES
jgi:hypothetical protein